MTCTIATMGDRRSSPVLAQLSLIPDIGSKFITMEIEWTWRDATSRTTGMLICPRESFSWLPSPPIYNQGTLEKVLLGIEVLGESLKLGDAYRQEEKDLKKKNFRYNLS